MSAAAESLGKTDRGARVDRLAWVLVGFGLLARVLSARVAYLLPDDRLHLDIARAAGLEGVYRASLHSPHPPLFLALLHYWMRVAHSPFALRMLSVAFGTAFLWTAYRWARSLFGGSAALTTLTLLAFLPSLVILSAEIRGYALLLFLTSAALLALEKAFERNSPPWLGGFAVLGGLALLTHYAALWFLLSASAYAAARLAAGGASPRFVRAWLASQAALAALFVLLGVTHISKLRGSEFEKEAQTTPWLQAGYFHAGQEGPFGYLSRQTAAFFQFLFSSRAGGLLALGLALAGIALLAGRRRPAAILLGLPFVLNAAAGLLALYPYGGTRHSVVLAPFAAAAVAVALARVSGEERLWMPVALAAALAPAGLLVGW